MRQSTESSLDGGDDCAPCADCVDGLPLLSRSFALYASWSASAAFPSVEGAVQGSCAPTSVTNPQSAFLFRARSAATYTESVRGFFEGSPLEGSRFTCRLRAMVPERSPAVPPVQSLNSASNWKRASRSSSTQMARRPLPATWASSSSYSRHSSSGTNRRAAGSRAVARLRAFSLVCQDVAAFFGVERVEIRAADSLLREV